MGKNKKGPKANVFKVAGAKSLKKTKAKVVNLGLKNIKQKVSEMDKEFLEISKTPKPTPPKSIPSNSKASKKPLQPVSKEEVAKTVDQIDKMDL